MTPPHPAKPNADAAEVLRERLRKAVDRAMDWAGSMPAKEAVKLRPSDWHAVCDAARDIAALAASPPDEITALRAERDALHSQLVLAKKEAKSWMAAFRAATKQILRARAALSQNQTEVSHGK